MASCSPWRLLQATGGSRTVHSGDDAIDDRAREKIGNGSQHGSSGVGADVPAVTPFLEQIRMHVGVFVDAEGEMVANRQREIDFADCVGGHVDREYYPAGKEQAHRYGASR